MTGTSPVMTVEAVISRPILTSWSLEPEHLRVDRGFQPAVDRHVGAVDPARAVRAQEQDHGRDVRGGAGAADAGDVVVDAGVAEHGAELVQDRGRDRAGTDGIDANAALLEQRLMGGALGP